MFFLASRFGFAPIAGTALMAAATVAIAEGRLSADDGWSAVRLDTAVGAAEVQVEIKDGNVIRAKWLRDRPQILVSDQAVACSDAITRSVSLVASGLPYAIVSEDDLGVALDDHARLGPAAAALSADVGAVYPLSRFGLEKEYSRYLVMVVSQPEHNRIRTVWISDKGEVARSAGGTGALAVFAALLARGSSKGEESMLVSAPGGSFLCEARGDSASVTADVRINARHEFYPLPSHLVGT
jgi:proline racemase